MEDYILLKLIEVNDENWLEFRKLSVSEAQKGFLDSPIGILARGYIYRYNRARVIGITDDDTVVGVALVKDLDDEPACYDAAQPPCVYSCPSSKKSGNTTTLKSASKRMTPQRSGSMKR